MKTLMSKEGLTLVETENADQLEASVSLRLGGRVRDLRLVIRGDQVIVKGSSRSYYAKQLAQHAVMELTGLKILANEIKVW